MARGIRSTCPTVLEQDYFYSNFLCSHATVQTNSHTRDDDRMRLFSLVKSGATSPTCASDDRSNWRGAKLSEWVVSCRHEADTLPTFTSSSFRCCVAAFHAISAPAFRLLLNVAVFGTHQRDVEFFAAPMVSIRSACFR